MMTFKSAVFLFFLLQLVAVETSAQSDVECPTISLTEGNQIVAYNSNENVTFYCEVDSGQQVVWQIQSSQYRTEEDKSLLFNRYGIIINNSQSHSSQLIITEVTRQIISLPELRVGCLPLIFCVTLSPEFRLVLKYGPLAAPQGLRLTAQNSNEFSFSWIKPDVPPGVQLTSYIEVMNLTSREFDAYNSTEELITFSKFGECSEFNITVYSSDDVSVNSEIGFIIENIPISPDVSPIEGSLNTTVVMRDGISIIVSFCPATVCSQSYPVLKYTVSLLTINSTLSVDLLPSLTTASCNPPLAVTVDSSNVPELAVDRKYGLTVTACSSITCRTTNSVTAYTTGVQNPIIYYINRTLLLACDFAVGSRASGCLFNFTSTSNKDGENMEIFNLTRNPSMVNSTVCGGSRTCMCVMTDNLPTTYLSIRAFTLENDKTLSEISLPVTLNNSQSNEEIVRECIQLFAQPMVAGGLSTGETAGITISFIIIFLIVGPVIFILACKLCLCYYERKEYEAFKRELGSGEYGPERIIEGHEVRHVMADSDAERFVLDPLGGKSSMLVVFLNNSPSALGQGELDKKLEAYEESSEASPLKSNLGKVVYIKDPNAVTELTKLINEHLE